MSDHPQAVDTAVTPSDRVARIVDEMTREEKLSLVHGTVDPAGNATGYLPGVERLGVPELRLADGPLGVRTEKPATAFPAALAVAATFDPDLARRQGVAMGREAKARNQDVLLGPGLNLVRVPQCGRNFEYYSEDPIVTGAFAAAVVAGIQSEDVIATPKHFVANNQETRRAAVSAAVDERVLRELYLPGFHDAVEAGAGSVMTAYNSVNGTHMSEHAHLVTEVLKGEWGFEGYVVSDWFGTESAVRAAVGGLDVEMPGGTLADQFESMGIGADELAAEMDPEIADGMPDTDSGGRFEAHLLDAIAAGDVPEARLDAMVARVLGQIERAGLLDGEHDAGAIDTPEHRSLAAEIATRGTVLLKNEGVLPLADDADVALIGPNVDEAIVGGGGSSETTPFEQTSPVEGITDRAAGAVTVERGVAPIQSVSLFDGLMGDATGSDDPVPDVDMDDAVAAASDADVAVVFVRDTATEAADRDSLALPGGQDELIDAVADANDETVVVLNTSGPVELPWRADVAAIVSQWYPGQAHGEIAAVLYGDADPGGRLPVTFAPEDAYPTADERRFPGVDDVAHYDEGLLVGYRHFDATDAEPTYPFGHGHSYADFAYESVETTDDGTVTVTVANTSDRDGYEVIQAYAAAPDAPDDLERPPRELAAFEAVAIPAGESRMVDLTLDDRALGRYDAEEGWTVDSGTCEISVGRSVRDLRGSVDLQI